MIRKLPNFTKKTANHFKKIRKITRTEKKLWTKTLRREYEKLREHSYVDNLRMLWARREKG